MWHSTFVGLKNVKVRTHSRLGRIVSGHNRRIQAVPSQPKNLPLQKTSLQALDVTGPPVLPRQTNLSEWGRELNKKHKELSDHLILKVEGQLNRKLNNLGKRLAVSAGIMGGGVGAAVASGIFFPPLFVPLFTVGILAGTSTIVEPVVTHFFRTRAAKWRTRREVRKKFDSGNSQIDRKTLKQITSFYPWKSTSPLAKKTFKEKTLNFLAKITPRIFRSRKKAHVFTSVMPGGAVAVSWYGLSGALHASYVNSSITPKGVTYFYPGVDLSNDRIAFPCNLRGANLEKINFKETKLYEVILDGANLKNANLYDAEIAGSMREANLEGADLREAHLREADLRGANLKGADLTGAILPNNIDGIDLSAEQFNSLTRSNDGSKYYKYKVFSFHEAIEELGVTEKQFEFLVLSDIIQVRDNETGDLVKSGYNPDIHHVAPWCLKTAKKVLAEQSAN